MNTKRTKLGHLPIGCPTCSTKQLPGTSGHQHTLDTGRCVECDLGTDYSNDTPTRSPMTTTKRTKLRQHQLRRTAYATLGESVVRWLCATEEQRYACGMDTRLDDLVEGRALDLGLVTVNDEGEYTLTDVAP